MKRYFHDISKYIKTLNVFVLTSLIFLNSPFLTFASTYGEGKYGGALYGIGDDTAPVISNISATNIIKNAAIINWTTNEPATSKVLYGKTTAYGSTTAEYDLSPMVTNHVINITGLNSCTTYHYRVVSQDSYNNTTLGIDKSFKTSGCVYIGVVQLPMTGSTDELPITEFINTSPTPTPIPPVDITILYTVKILVTDSNNNPVENAKVSLYSKVMENMTNKLGIAEFNNVLPGEHRVVIEYNNIVKEQNFDLNGSNTIFEMNLSLPAPVNYSFQIFILLLAAIIAIVTIRSYLIWKRKPLTQQTRETKINFRRSF